jgi:peptide deformylase
MRAMVLKILTGADLPILRAKTKKVPAVTKDVQKFLKEMQAATVKADGLGLAAPQVGSDQRMCVARINGRLTPLVNPEITWRSKAVETAEEGCLSLPGVWVPVPRSIEITVKFQTAKGDWRELRLSDMDARVVQHETDHLDGKLIIDYVSPAAVL